MARGLKGRDRREVRPRPRPLSAGTLRALAPAGLELPGAAPGLSGQCVLPTEHAQLPLRSQDQVCWDGLLLPPTRVVVLTIELDWLTFLWLVFNFESLGQVS